MQEPAYILKNGTPVPYVPVEVKNARDAYAASLHVLFKHVADFHICIVRAFSAKYGIPEDDILKTIQESDEFKNMQVDPVLDTDTIDSLGYLGEAPAPKEEMPAPMPTPTPMPVKKAKPTNAKKTKNPEPESNPIADPVVVVVATKESMPTVELEQEPIKPTKTIRKKIIAPKTNDPTPTPEPTVVLAEESRPDAEPEPEPIKLKTIRKKVIAKPTQPIAEPTQPIAEPVKAAPATTAAAEDAPRKIIKKKTKATA